MLISRFLGSSRIWFVLVTLFILFQTVSASATEGCFVSSAQDILQCALNQHPDIINAKAEKFRDDKLTDIAKQRPNPELESKILGGQSADDTNLNTETSLLHTVELGGKRKYRINQAKVLTEKSDVSVKKSREEVALQTVLALNRLRQIKSELSRVNEALATFNKILFMFKSRPKLPPEQEVSQSSFDLARDDYKLKNISILQEQAGLIAWLEIATGVSEQDILRHLPATKNKWPQFENSTETAQSSNAEIEGARSEKKLSAANFSIAKSKTWPDLKIGPTVDTESLDSGGTRWLGGVNFSVTLPILNLNRGEKAFAKADQLRAQTNLDLVTRKTESERTLQLKRYHISLTALHAARQVGGLESDHQSMEVFFEKGLVSSTLVIETHRQLYEITRTRNEQELEAIEALWKLYILDGTFTEKTI